ncbi:MAG TPA: hypothetical protein VMT95_12005 [Candidatus Binatia bacterium]|nr:hypothetical protein [Candidatus Binatia bacterium]
MKLSFFGSAAAATLALASATGLTAAPAQAMGTVTIQQPNGARNTYHDAVIKVIHNALFITSADGKGTLVINRAACAYQGAVLVCFVTSATLVQAGKTSPLDFRNGTVYVNMTDQPQALARSTMKVPAKGIVSSFTTARGTYVNMIGSIDKVVK